MKTARRPGTAVAEKMRRTLAAYPPQETYLVGVSGGRDSVALLHLLREAGYGNLVVCHLDHCVRPESGADAEFVATLARQWNFPAVIESAPVPKLARTTKSSLETASRNARRAFFANVAVTHKCQRIFLAHHADDQVETFLFRLLRGAGTAGLAAMRAEAQLFDKSNVRVVRPMLGIWQEEIDAYVRAHELPFREDSSNGDSAHTRNRLRGAVIPFLDREFGREVRESLRRAAEVLGAEDRWLETLVGDTPARLDVKTIRPLPLAHQRRLARRWLRDHGASTANFEEIGKVLSLLDDTRGPAKVNLAKGWHARRRAGHLFLEPPGKTNGTRLFVSDEE